MLSLWLTSIGLPLVGYTSKDAHGYFKVDIEETVEPLPQTNGSTVFF